ncbi:hypothetical protein ACFORL_11065 [Legionella dresdenensis]|uniref:Uncharacterized protein n=1 Tax=Legionella dresdenensis TaxID=450200 RepID=A0ABV8CHZ3_9GAMM
MSNSTIITILLALVVCLVTIIIYNFVTNMKKNAALFKAVAETKELIKEKISQDEKAVSKLLSVFFPDNVTDRWALLRNNELEFSKDMLKLLVSSQPIAIETFPALMDKFKAAYLVCLEEIVQIHNTIKDMSHHLTITTPLGGEAETNLKECIYKMSELVNEQVDENSMEYNGFLVSKLPPLIQKMVERFGDVEERFVQYDALIEQLRHEKLDMESKNEASREVLQLVYDKYGSKLGLKEPARPVLEMSDEEMQTLFEVNELVKKNS